MSMSNFGNAVKKFADAGINRKWFLPIAPVDATVAKSSAIEDSLGKTPAAYVKNKDMWKGLSGKEYNYIKEGLRKSDWQEMREWPTPNAGILGRAFPGIDSDAESDDARRLIEDVIDETFGHGAIIPVRLRGKGPRRLYAFKCIDPDDDNALVRGRHISYEYRGEKHKIDVIGYGNQYVITGTHPKGDQYTWDKEFGLHNPAVIDDMLEIDNNDINRFIETLHDHLERAGGKVLRAREGAGPNEDWDPSKVDGTMSLDTVEEALAKLPNTEENFPERDDLVTILSAVKAALGRDGNSRDAEDICRDWATKDDWADDDYFDKVWDSIRTVRVPQDYLDRLLRKNGVRTHVKDVFQGDPKQFRENIKKEKKAAANDREALLNEVADRYIFGNISHRENAARSLMRHAWSPDRDWGVIEWYKGELAESDPALLEKLHKEFPPTKPGCATFLRELEALHPEVFYSGEIFHPGFDKGEVYQDVQQDGTTKNLVNMRGVPLPIRLARKPPKDPAQSKKDLKHILDFANRLFGKYADYELDTLAYMAQTGDRPGAMLFLVGDSGVGKSIWMNMQMALFDGTGPEGSAVLDGAKLRSEQSRRFLLAGAEGRRLVSIKELPEGARAHDMAAVTSTLKQMVDPGPEGDYMQIERKGKDVRYARNFSRVLISSNYENAIYVEMNDRRIFYVKAAIDLSNRPSEEYYGELVDIIRDPERLATLFRYLRTRDIGNFSRYTAPPVSEEKQQRIIAEIENPARRHCRAAMAWLRASNRILVDADELCEIMTRVSNNEFANSGGAVDERQEYTTREGAKGGTELMMAIKTMTRGFAVKLEKTHRTSTKRFPAVYVMVNHAELLPDLLAMTREELFDMVDREYERNLARNPLELYADPE